MRFDVELSTLEEKKHLDKMTMDYLHGILTAYEMRIEKENPSRKEATFKASKETKKKEHKPSESSIDESEEEKVNFIRKLKKGLGKYKGKLPCKLFNCGRIWSLVQNVPIQKTRITMMKKITLIKKLKRNLKREKLETKRDSMKRRKAFIPKKIVVHLMK